MKGKGCLPADARRPWRWQNFHYFVRPKRIDSPFHLLSDQSILIITIIYVPVSSTNGFTGVVRSRPIEVNAMRNSALLIEFPWSVYARECFDPSCGFCMVSACNWNIQRICCQINNRNHNPPVHRVYFMRFYQIQFNCISPDWNWLDRKLNWKHFQIPCMKFGTINTIQSLFQINLLLLI